MSATRIRDRVRAAGHLPEGRAVVAMLSGGRDSVCLIDIAVTLCGAERVRALHVNYGLRADADADEAHCRELCSQLGVEIEVVRVERDLDAPGNLHAWAREFRYGAADTLARERDALVATGHTATDQVETILYRLAASPGRRALLGMPEREGRLVRPLLGVTRIETAAYCRERGLAWREDESNDSPAYARARVRVGMLPALEAVHPAASSNVLRTAALLREETDLLDTLVDAELANDASESGGARGASIAIERLRAMQPALARLLVIRLAEDVSHTYVPQAGERVGEILALAERGGTAQLHVGGLVCAVIRDGRLRMVAIEPRAQY